MLRWTWGRWTMQCYVIVTSRSLLWLLLTLVSTLAVLSAVLTPRWIVGPSISHALKPLDTGESVSRLYSRTLGLFTRCTLISGREQCASFAGMTQDQADGGAGFPGPWQASLTFLVLGLILGVLTTLAALLGCCIQAVCANKSLFHVAGAAQGAAGVLYILGIMLFPFGFGSERVRRICGEDADIYFLGDCSFGWSFYAAVVGILGTFICAVLSHQAESATSSDRVQEEIDEGKNLICLP
ncbi:hypothetical protein B566_EDAN004343 [Ephemera danica]|nr:hypothetical protein B566_EDAN004343 [Ephemera danica]